MQNATKCAASQDTSVLLQWTWKIKAAPQVLAASLQVALHGAASCRAFSQHGRVPQDHDSAVYALSHSLKAACTERVHARPSHTSYNMNINLNMPKQSVAYRQQPQMQQVWQLEQNKPACQERERRAAKLPRGKKAHDTSERPIGSMEREPAMMRACPFE